MHETSAVLAAIVLFAVLALALRGYSVARLADMDFVGRAVIGRDGEWSTPKFIGWGSTSRGPRRRSARR
jgi:hypothetical protein